MQRLNIVTGFSIASLSIVLSWLECLMLMRLVLSNQVKEEKKCVEMELCVNCVEHD